MNKKDLSRVAVIGGAVGLLAQPVLANLVGELSRVTSLSGGAIRIGFFFFFLILAPVALFVAYLISKFIPVIYQFAKFAAVGSLNSFVDLGVFNLETFLLGSLPGTVLFAAFKAFSFLCATTNSFFWNKYWTFESKGSAGAGEVTKFYAIAITGGFLNVAVATFVKTLAPATVPATVWVNLVAPVVGIFAVLMWNFLGYKFFVFKKSAGASAAPGSY